MKLKLLKKPSLASLGFHLTKERFKSIITALVVVIIVGGTFLYLFNKDVYRESFVGSFLGGLFVSVEDSVDQESQEPQIADYKEQAQQGEGLTHVARRVIDNHFQENDIVDFNAEQKIFMEDYIQKKLGSEPLMINQEVVISQELIAQAIQEAERLTESELNNLKQYSSLVFL